MEHQTPSDISWKFPETQSAGAPLFSFLFAGKPANAQGSTLGAADPGGGAPTAPLPHHSRLGSGAVHMKLRTAPVHRSRAQLGAGVGQVACSL